MAGSHTCYNFPSTRKDKLAKNTLRASTKGNGTSTLTFVAFWAPTLAPAPAFAPTPTLVLPGLYMDVDLQRATKLALESFVQD